MATESRTPLKGRELLALEGFRLPKTALGKIQKAGILCVSRISIEYQEQARRHVLRGQESGGAIAEFGLYSGFAAADGSVLPWLQRVHSLGVNGIHSRVFLPELVRVQMTRVERNYDLLITRHVLGPETGRARPTLENSILFLGRQGTLELELWGKDETFRGKVMPRFLSRAGETTSVPDVFHDAVLRAVSGVTCIGCRHSHLLAPPDTHANQSEPSEYVEPQ